MRTRLAVLALIVTAGASPCFAGKATALPDLTSAIGYLIPIADQPLGAVLKQIGQRIPGRALDARRVERDGRKLYRVKWLGDDGKVRDVTVDAESGEILRIR